MGSESHLTEKMITTEIVPVNYTATRKDRADGRGGVIVIYR